MKRIFPSLACRHSVAVAWLLAGGAVLLPLTEPTAWAAEPAGQAGFTEPFLDVTLSASVPGIIAARKFKEGDSVQEGDVIVELDKALEELEVERRKLVVEVRRRDSEGTARLFQTSKGTSKEEMMNKESDHKLAVVEHAMAVEQLRRRVLASPLSGTIVEFLVEPGESCQPYQPLVRVVDTRQGFFIANLEAKAAAALKLKQEVDLEIETGAGAEPVKGSITFLSPVADPASGLIKVRVLFENPTGRIRPGLAGRMKSK